MIFTRTVTFDISPRLEQLWRESLNQQDSQIMATIAEFKKNVLDRIAQLQAASATEHQEVLAVIEALKGQVTDIVQESDVAEVSDAFDAALAGVGNIFTPDPAAAARKR